MGTALLFGGILGSAGLARRAYARCLESPQHQGREVDKLYQSLAADLDLRPILATSDGSIFAGTQRCSTAQHLGWDTVPPILLNIPDALAR